MLEASSSTEEDQLQWEGLVESKIRHLISQLERENISLAHVWPKPYSGQEESTRKTTCYWFVGLIVGGSAGAHLDLTLPIKTFTDIVMRSAIQISVWKTGMRIEANYKKRKALAPFLPESEHWKLKPDRKGSVVVPASPNGLKRPSPSSPPPTTKRMNSGGIEMIEEGSTGSNGTPPPVQQLPVVTDEATATPEEPAVIPVDKMETAPTSPGADLAGIKERRMEGFVVE